MIHYLIIIIYKKKFAEKNWKKDIYYNVNTIAMVISWLEKKLKFGCKLLLSKLNKLE